MSNETINAIGFEPHTSTIAPAVPMENERRFSFSASAFAVLWRDKANSSRSEGKRSLIKFAYLALIIFVSLSSFASQPQPGTLKELLALSPSQLENCDVARMNLLCAEGLPGLENLKVDDGLVTLDEWARHIQLETDRNFHHYFDDPAYYYNSTNFFKMLMMAVVLYEDYNIRYNPKWIETPAEVKDDDHFAADSRDIFINGLVGPQRMGTCSSMPVLYVALARRLGYPVKLVTTKEHLFMRWESVTERFDMDATGKGLDKYDDNFYKKFPFPVTEQEIKEEGYLKSLSPQEELSVFLFIRGECLVEAGRAAEAAASFDAAYQRAPNWKANQAMRANVQEQFMPRYVPLSIAAREPRTIDVVSEPPGVDTGTPNMPDLDPLKEERQAQQQNPLINPMPNP